MPNPVTETGFIDVVSRNTGKRQAIPAHWWGGPLAKSFDLYVDPEAGKALETSESETEVEPEAVEPEPEPVKAPAKSAPKDDWIAWAVHKGGVFDEVKELTQDELIKKYGR